MTVIATGFNRQARAAMQPRTEARRAEPETVRAQQPAQQGWTEMWEGSRTNTATTTPPPGPAEVPQPGLQMVNERSAGTHWEPKSTEDIRSQLTQSDLKEMMAEVGVPEARDDQFDIPTFLRKQAD